MPKLKVEHIISFSSEDPSHVASNVLNMDTTKKWKCKTPGEKSAFIILQLEKASVISSIDIGNDHSAYVEVLVARSGAATHDSDYKVLLSMSTFMTPIESRQSSNTSKVRMFKSDQFQSPERDEKWDRVKIVCTQPFNSRVQYGLTFVTLNELEDTSSSAPTTVLLGKFALRPPSPNDLVVGSFFAKRKEGAKDLNTSTTAAVAIREASASSSLDKPSVNLKLTPKRKTVNSDVAVQPRNRNDILYDDDDEKPNEKVDKVMEEKYKENAKKKERELEQEKTKKKEKLKESAKKNKEKKKESKEIMEDKPENEQSRKRTASKENAPAKRQKVATRSKPFNKLLENVVFVISGIPNPDRANLRSRALEMGAKYKPDWDNTCTHLICAFANTPKYQQVHGKGKIITRKWIEDCHSHRKRLPWRRYAMDKDDQEKDESEEEILEYVEPFEHDMGDEDYDSVKDEGSDTEARIAQIQSKANETEDLPTNSSNPIEIDTDEDVPPPPPNGTADQLPTLFANKIFYIDPTVYAEEEQKYLKRYITAYGGVWLDNACDAVEIVVTDENNSKYLTSVTSSSAVCVKSKWIWECHNSKCIVPIVDFKC